MTNDYLQHEVILNDPEFKETVESKTSEYTKCSRIMSTLKLLESTLYKNTLPNIRLQGVG